MVKLVVALELGLGTPDTELITTAEGTTSTTEVVTGTALAVASDEAGAAVVDGADVEDSADAADELPPPTCTAGPTSGCSPDFGSVSRPQVVPAADRVRP